MNDTFLTKLKTAWKFHGGVFTIFMDDAIYLAEWHTEIVFSTEERLEAFDKIINDGNWKSL